MRSFAPSETLFHRCNRYVCEIKVRFQGQQNRVGVRKRPVGVGWGLGFGGGGDPMGVSSKLFFGTSSGQSNSLNLLGADR